MPFRRRQFRKRPMRRRAPIRRRRFNRIPRLRSKIHNFKQSCELQNVTVTAGTTAFFGYNFKLGDLPAPGSFTNLFDQYRLMAVKIRFIPEFNVYQATPSSPITLPVIYTVIDYDTSSAPTTVGQLDQYDTLKVRTFTRLISRYFKPRPQITSFEGGGVALANRSTWFSNVTNTVTYEGIRGCITASSAGSLAAQLVRVTATYYIQCKSIV